MTDCGSTRSRRFRRRYALNEVDVLCPFCLKVFTKKAFLNHLKHSILKLIHYATTRIKKQQPAKPPHF